MAETIGLGERVGRREGILVGLSGELDLQRLPELRTSLSAALDSRHPLCLVRPSEQARRSGSFPRLLRNLYLLLTRANGALKGGCENWFTRISLGSRRGEGNEGSRKPVPGPTE
jgi:hypothetical protein